MISSSPIGAMHVSGGDLIFVSSIAFSTPVVHYQHRRGEAVALVKSFVGLGGAAGAKLKPASPMTGRAGSLGRSASNAAV